MLRLLRPRFQITDADPNVVAFFFQQYVELVKHGKDKTDQAMKTYLFDVITQLGVPVSVPTIEEAEVVEVEPSYPIINRRKHGC